MEGDQDNLTTKQTSPSILIGMDYFWDLVLSDQFTISPLPSGYRVIHTRIGKIVADDSFRHSHTGFLATDEPSSPAHPAKYAELLELVERFWSNESMGIMDDPTTKDEERCLQLFNSSISYNQNEKRYSIKLPFKCSPS